MCQALTGSVLLSPAQPSRQSSSPGPGLPRLPLSAEDWGSLPAVHRLVGLVVKAYASRAEDPGFESRLRRVLFVFFFPPGSSHTSDLKIGTPVATLPGAWRYRVSARTGRPGVSVL